jgi:hypothetical protein
VTITNERPTPEVPKWLDLDAIVPPEIRDRIAMLTEHLTESLRDLSIEAAVIDELLDDYANATTGAGDVSQLVDRLTGYNELCDLAWLISAMFAIHGSSTDQSQCDIAEGKYGVFLSGSYLARFGGPQEVQP